MVQGEEDKVFMSPYADAAVDPFLLFDDDRPRSDTSSVKIPDDLEEFLDNLCERLRSHPITA